ncbi:hypothetical protein NC651_025126 [Populus alba x Populus x berolinensis]|nr:hypothetical protein NC651_025126 [Populus alba x Populus x berolinensis]
MVQFFFTGSTVICLGFTTGVSFPHPLALFPGKKVYFFLFCLTLCPLNVLTAETLILPIKIDGNLVAPPGDHRKLGIAKPKAAIVLKELRSSVSMQ